MKNFTKYAVYTFIAAISVTSVFSCKTRSNTKLTSITTDQDSLLIAKANRIADSEAKVNYKPVAAGGIDTAKILSNPDYAFVHNCCKNNAQQMEIIHFGMVNGFEKKIKLASKGMWNDYAKLNTQLKEYALRNNIPLSNDTTVDLSYANSMDGQTWDSTWIDLVIRDQTAMLSDFQKAQGVVKDPQLQEVINGHMPAINKHLEVASNLKRTY